VPLWTFAPPYYLHAMDNLPLLLRYALLSTYWNAEPRGWILTDNEQGQSSITLGMASWLWVLEEARRSHLDPSRVVARGWDSGFGVLRMSPNGEKMLKNDLGLENRRAADRPRTPHPLASSQRPRPHVRYVMPPLSGRKQ
jgi:hypothetical protein